MKKKAVSSPIGPAISRRERVQHFTMRRTMRTGTEGGSGPSLAR
jgi:hypothetical protein